MPSPDALPKPETQNQKPVYDHPDVHALIERALLEDLRFTGDRTCQALVPPQARLDCAITAKQAGVICGLALFERIALALGDPLEFCAGVDDGTPADAGAVVFRARGRGRTLLMVERTALNLCQRLSGTATIAAAHVAAVAGTRAAILDTRKTTPGLRTLEKHAVTCGGAHNHRIGLYDQVLIKENHIALMGDAPVDGSPPAEAVRRCRERLGGTMIIEVEIERLDDLAPAIRAGADIVLCDNLPPDALRRAVAIRDATPAPHGRRVLIEASGGITLANIRAYAEAGVDRISCGALTHSVTALDLSMRCTPVP